MALLDSGPTAQATAATFQDKAYTNVLASNTATEARLELRTQVSRGHLNTTELDTVLLVFHGTELLYTGTVLEAAVRVYNAIEFSTF